MVNPKVSVIMGVLNAENRVIESIKSIQNQTMKDFEFIICDDGSSDNTVNVLKNIASEDERIIVVENEKNMGLAITLNKCIELARGEYIARMDDDDYSYNTRFEKQVSFLDANKTYSIVSSGVDIYDGKEIIIKGNLRKEFPKKEDFLMYTQFVHPATMFRSKDLKAVDGYRVDKETRRTEDYDLFMRMYSKGMKGYNIQEPLLRYFVNEEAMKKKRKYKYRIDESIVRYKGFKSLGMLPKGYIYVIKPLIVGLIPHNTLFNIKKTLSKIKNK